MSLGGWPGGSWLGGTWGSSFSSTSSTAPGRSSCSSPRIAPGLSISTSGTSSASPGFPPRRSAASRRSRSPSSSCSPEIRRPLPDTFHGLTETETRYRQRYLDLLMSEDSRRDFEVRARMVASIRRYLDGHGFVEVETPILQPRYGGALADPFVTRSNELDQTLYLRIATELYLKRLIVGGLERVYELGRDFRNESVSLQARARVHHGRVVRGLRGLRGHDAADRGARRDRRARRRSGRRRSPSAGTRSTSPRRGSASSSSSSSRSAGSGRVTRPSSAGSSTNGAWTRARTTRGASSSTTRSATSSSPTLIQPTILHDYPVEVSPFARPTDDDPSIVERFEFFVGGMELGNAFTEINDPDEQAERFAQQAADAQGQQGDPDYVEALAYGMPPTGGLGLGIDRLAMVLTGKENIRDTILFPALRERD